MRIIPVENNKTTRPITIEFSGREVEELASLIANMGMDDFVRFVSQSESSSNIKGFGVTPDQLDGLTDNLFEILMDHIEECK